MSEYRVECWDHPSAPKGGKRWQLMRGGETYRCAKGTIDADGKILVTAGAVPTDAKDWFPEACAKAARPEPAAAPKPTPPARPTALPAPKPELARPEPKPEPKPKRKRSK